MDPRAALAWILDRPPVVVLRTILDTYGRAAGGLLANGLAFSSLFAAVPATLLVLGLAGWLAAGDPAVQQDLRDALSRAFPPLAGLIDGSVQAIVDGAALTSIVGVVGVIWTVSQLFGAIDVAFARIFFDEPERDPLRRTLRGFGVVVLIAVAVVMVIAGIGLLAAIDTAGGRQGTFARAVLDVLGSPPAVAVLACGAVIAAYRKLPPKPPSWWAILIPAAVVGAVLAILGQAFSLLVPWLVGVADLTGSLASGFVALAWLSFSFQALLIGAAWVRVRDAGPPSPAEAARAASGSASLERAAAAAEPRVGGE
jgi:YihY family inner membrane protein